MVVLKANEYGDGLIQVARVPYGTDAFAVITIDEVAFLGKTGTITQGKPQLVAFELIDTTLDSATIECIANNLAVRSEHPLSKAIAEGITADLKKAIEFQAVVGRGEQGVIEAYHYALANHPWIRTYALLLEQI